MALSLTARTNHWYRPQVVEEPVLKLKNGRHPLVERLVESYIPNSTILVPPTSQAYPTETRADWLGLLTQIGGRGVGSETGSAGSSEGEERQPMRTDSIMIVTGANYSGKSVHLKSVALITFLAHIGKYIAPYPHRQAN